MVKIQHLFFLGLPNNCLHLHKKMHAVFVNVGRVLYHLNEDLWVLSLDSALTNCWLTLHGIPWSFFNSGHCNKLATLIIFYRKPTCSCFCIYFNDIFLHRLLSIHNILSKWNELIISRYTYIYLNGIWNESIMNKCITWQDLSPFNNVALEYELWK